MANNFQKSWLSPFMAVTYFAVAITGLFMLFHLRFPGMYSVHKWVGLIFIICSITHLILNWRIFVSYFTKSKAIWGTFIGLLALIIIAIAVPSNEHKNRYHDGIKSTFNYGSNIHKR